MSWRPMVGLAEGLRPQRTPASERRLSVFTSILRKPLDTKVRDAATRVEVRACESSSWRLRISAGSSPQS
jgi:hypothetical protein